MKKWNGIGDLRNYISRFTYVGIINGNKTYKNEIMSNDTFANEEYEFILQSDEENTHELNGNGSDTSDSD